MRKMLLLTLCLMLTGCTAPEADPPAASSTPAMSINDVVEEAEMCRSDDGRYWAYWKDGTLTVTDIDLDQTMDLTLPEGSPFPAETEVTDMAWNSPDEWTYHLFLETSQGDYLFIPHQWYETLSGDTFYCAFEALSGDYDFTQDGTPEAVSLLTVTDPDGETVDWYELWVEQDGKVLLREEFATAHAGYNSLLACRRDGKDYLFRYRPGFGMGYGYYGYQLFTLGESGQTVQEGSVEFNANFSHPSYQGPFDAAAIAAFFRESYALMEESTLLFSTEDGDFWPEIGGTEFFWETDIFDLPEDPAKWEQHLADYETELAATRIGQ